MNLSRLLADASTADINRLMAAIRLSSDIQQLPIRPKGRTIARNGFAFHSKKVNG